MSSVWARQASSAGEAGAELFDALGAGEEGEGETERLAEALAEALGEAPRERPAEADAEDAEGDAEADADADAEEEAVADPSPVAKAWGATRIVAGPMTAMAAAVASARRSFMEIPHPDAE
ncbi:hypothetical protein [Streptomyces rectiverticillatus]|uniref:hypothetical protein n=1 Tax=Streptomyces rectiverticillatus TaxID=173860 RepID=UPI0015C2C31A|nr:hypothetical protein [Streptomyces rectiverticillatus]